MPSDSSWPSTRHSLLAKVNNWSDTEAWQTMVTTYAPLVFRYARRKGLQAADAEDVSQETMLRIRKLEYDPARGRFRSWLAVTTSRLIMDHKQRESRPGRRGRGTQDSGAGSDENFSPVLESGSPVVGGAHSVDPEWEEIFFSRMVETACKRIQTEFPEKHWEIYARLNSPKIKTQQTEVDPHSISSLAKEFGVTPGAIYKIKHRISQRLKTEIEFLSADLPVASYK